MLFNLTGGFYLWGQFDGFRFGKGPICLSFIQVFSNYHWHQDAYLRNDLVWVIPLSNFLNELHFKVAKNIINIFIIYGEDTI